MYNFDRQTRVILLAAASGAILIASSCGQPSAANHLGASAEQPRVVMNEPGVRMHGVELSLYQQRLLQKGFVTKTEYADSVNRTVSCMRDGGLEVHGPADSAGKRFLEYGYAVTAETEQELLVAQKEGNQLADDCYTQYESAIGEAWTRQTTLSDNERATQFKEFGLCLQTAGLPLDDNSTPTEIGEAIDDVYNEERAKEEASTIHAKEPDAVMVPIESCILLHTEPLATADRVED